MAEGNGTGRLDRIEALLEKTGEKLDRVATMGYLHDERLSRIEVNFEEIQQNFKEMQARDRHMDERIATLVSAIGTFIATRQTT